MRRLAARLNILPGLRVYYSDKNDQSGVLSVVPVKMSCDALSERLGAAGIAVRSGLHCAPLAHDTAGHAPNRNGPAERFAVQYAAGD